MRKFYLLAGTFLFALSLHAKPHLSFEEDAVVARVSKGAKTAWFVVVHEWNGYVRTIRSGAFEIRDDDGDGIVRYPLRGRRAAPAFWMVVDLGDGSYAIDAPKGLRIRRNPLHAGAHEPSDSKGRGRLKQAATFTTFFIARPGVGAWVAKTRDGAEGDADGATDGNVMSRIEVMTPVGDSPAPPEDLQRDDVVAIADLLALTIQDGRVAK